MISEELYKELRKQNPDMVLSACRRVLTWSNIVSDDLEDGRTVMTLLDFGPGEKLRLLVRRCNDGLIEEELISRKHVTTTNGFQHMNCDHMW
jgi:hypothetical protein